MDDRQKQAAAEAACAAVAPGTVVGLGSGSTAAHAIDHLGAAGPADLRCVPTSLQARRAALAAGLDVVELDQVATIDTAIDGADQVGPDAIIKGGGGAHTREKIVDTYAEELLVVVDDRKPAETLTAAVPVAVLPTACEVVAAAVRELGATPTLRTATEKSGPVVTDNGNLILDCAFGPIEAPADLAAELATIPGVVEHGLFVGVTDRIYVGTDTGVEVSHR